MPEHDKNELFGRFQRFVKNITPKDRIALCYHRDPDGLASALLVSKAIEKYSGNKIRFLHASDYNELHVLEKAIAEESPDKIIIVDLSLDSKLNSFAELNKHCKSILMLDHHKIYQDLNSEDIIFIKSQYVNEELDGSKYPVSKLSYDLFSNLVDLSKSRWIACLGIIGDNGYSSWEPFFNKVMHEDNISIEELRSGTELINSIETIHPELFPQLFDYLNNCPNLNDFLNSEFNEYRQELYDMADKILAEMDDKADIHNSISLIIYKINAKYNIKSFIANQMSYENPAKTIVVMQEMDPDRIWFSARRQDFKLKMNELLEEAIKGIPDSSAGGHIPASAGSIPKAYEDKFKENIVRILKEGK